MNYELLKNWICENYKNQQEFAKEAGLTRQYLYALLSGKRNIGKKIAQKLGNQFGFSYNYLILNDGPLFPEGTQTNSSTESNKSEGEKLNLLNDNIADLRRQIKKLHEELEEKNRQIKDLHLIIRSMNSHHRTGSSQYMVAESELELETPGQKKYEEMLNDINELREEYKQRKNG